ncbi:MAG: MBL fold metallo-hydrolase [Desulfobacterales bacterium]|nr:MAG: MBL fold metallo-hydrolase [Desulfobacterales bacterium]
MQNKAGLTTSWGFACVIKGAEKTILFDTGGSSAVLLGNMQRLGIDPKEIDMLVLSHIQGVENGWQNRLSHRTQASRKSRIQS